MPKDRKPTPEQRARASRLRGAIDGAGAGKAPAVPKSPREITDEAARRKWEESRKDK